MINVCVDLRIETLFDRTLKLLCSTQPGESATGATLIQCFAQLNLLNLCQLIHCDDNQQSDQIYLLINFISERLNNEIKRAKISLSDAARMGPMYGWFNCNQCTFTNDQN